MTSPNDTLKITNIRIFDSYNGAFSSMKNLTIREGVIAGIDEAGAGTLETEPFLDCQGGYAVPGLWECHGHLMELGAVSPEVRSMILTNQNLPSDSDWDHHVQDQLTAFLKRGVTHIRDVGGPLDSLETLVQSMRNGQYTGPNIRYAGPMLEKPPLHWASKNRRYPGFTVPIETRQDVDTMLDSLACHGASLVKTFNKFDQDMLAYLLERAVEHHLPVTLDPGCALYHWIPMEYAIELGIQCFEHAQAALPSVLKTEWRSEIEPYRFSPPESEENRALFRKIMTHSDDVIDRERLRDLCQLMVDRDVCICPTLFTLQPMRTRFTDAPLNAGEELRRKINETFCDLMHTIIDAMASAGVRILVGHDSSFARGVALEMGFLSEWGVKPAEIIKGATLYPAQWIGADDLYGTIEVNKIADLVILDENPLDNIANIETVRAVYHQGKWID